MAVLYSKVSMIPRVELHIKINTEVKIMEQKILKVYDTLTKEYVDVEVSGEVYKAYKRTEWNIDKQDSSFEQYVIMFCDS